MRTSPGRRGGSQDSETVWRHAAVGVDVSTLSRRACFKYKLLLFPTSWTSFNMMKGIGIGDLKSCDVLARQWQGGDGGRRGTFFSLLVGGVLQDCPDDLVAVKVSRVEDLRDVARCVDLILGRLDHETLKGLDHGQGEGLGHLRIEGGGSVGQHPGRGGGRGEVLTDRVCLQTLGRPIALATVAFVSFPDPETSNWYNIMWYLHNE